MPSVNIEKPKTRARAYAENFVIFIMLGVCSLFVAVVVVLFFMKK